MAALASIQLGTTSVRITRLGLGTGPLGGLFQEVSEVDARSTIEMARRLGVTYFDTAPLYGYGTAERRLGAVISEWDRDSFQVSSKVGRLLRVPTVGTGSAEPQLEIDDTQEVDGQSIFKNIAGERPVWDFSYDATMRELEESLERLQIDHVDVALIHDPDDHLDAAVSGSARALLKLRDEGIVGAIGVGTDYCSTARYLIERANLDCVLLAGRYTLLDPSAASELFPQCRERRIAVIAASVFNSGVLAANAEADEQTYWYRPASGEILERTAVLRDLCQEYAVPLKAAALQFPLQSDVVGAVVVGARSASEVEEDVEMFSSPIPEELWAGVERLQAGWA